jgi:hypothetical protein
VSKYLYHYLWLTIAATLISTGNADMSLADSPRHPVPREHPRLLGSRERLQTLAQQRPEAYQRMVRVAREMRADDHSKMISLSLVAAIERDAALGRQAVDMAMEYVRGPIRHGHVTFAHDLARCAIVYDLCHEHWDEIERTAFIGYFNQTVNANINSETHVFHNGWYGYKNWGIGLAGYATYYENERAPSILEQLQEEFLQRATPALELAGDGGGWGEGYYINYWLYEWLFFCEVARHCEGIDYYAFAPKFFANRAVASMFEAYPGIRQYGSRRPVPMGDGGGRTFGGDRGKVLSARRILVSHFRDDPDHQAVHTFNETTPRSGVGVYAYKDFLWRDETAPQGDLETFKLSHFSPGPGYVYARSDWSEDATYFFFKCGDRFTSHQHLDLGHFSIYRNEELTGDGGHYDSFGTLHDVNYHLRTIAHSTLLVLDPEESWPAIRAGRVTGNDGGQHHDWPHHNGAAVDADDWQRQKHLFDIGDILAFEDRGTHLYIAADATRAYSPEKLALFTRQIVYIRPGSFVIFDQVESRNPNLKKKWLLQAMKEPIEQDGARVITNGQSRLFVQTLLPENPRIESVGGRDLYRYGGTSYEPTNDTGPAPEYRVEVSPAKPSTTDLFLHLLTATDADTRSVPEAEWSRTEEEITVNIGAAKVTFAADRTGGRIEIAGKRIDLTDTVQTQPAPEQDRYQYRGVPY